MRLSPPELSEIINRDNFITSDKFLYASGHFSFAKRDFIFRPGRWRGKMVLPIWIDPLAFRNKTLVIGASDFSTGFSELVKLKLIGISRVFGTNTLNTVSFSHSIPLGLTNNCNDSYNHTILGNTKHFIRANQVSNFCSEFNASIYVNFSKDNNLIVRKALLAIVAKMKNVVYGNFEISDKSRIKYLEDLRSHALVLCPEGNGIDTHRLWETIYMGGTPVITRNKFLPDILSELPVIQLDKWSDLGDMKLMEAHWNNLQSRKYDFNSLLSEYWINLFNATDAKRDVFREQ